MLAAAAIGALAGCRLAVIIPLAVWGAILAGGLLVERWRYQGLTDDRLGCNWQATPERFVDPETGRLVTMFFQPGDWRAALRRRCRASARVPELTRRCRFSRDGAVAPAAPPCIRSSEGQPLRVMPDPAGLPLTWHRCRPAPRRTHDHSCPHLTIRSQNDNIQLVGE